MSRLRVDELLLNSCQQCRIVWQKSSPYVNPYSNGKENYYKDFPHYGLNKEICPKCKEVKHGITS